MSFLIFCGTKKAEKKQKKKQKHPTGVSHFILGVFGIIVDVILMQTQLLHSEICRECCVWQVTDPRMKSAIFHFSSMSDQGTK